MAQNNTTTVQQQTGSAPPSIVDKFLQDQLLQRGNMSKASLRSQLTGVQNRMDKRRDRINKSKQKVEAALRAMREDEAALCAAEAEENRLKALLQEVPMDIGRI